MKTLDRLFQKLVDMNKQPQVKRKVRSIGNYFASIFVGLITVTIGASIFVGGLIFFQPVINATQNYINTLNSNILINIVSVFPLEYYVAFLIGAICFVFMGTIRVFRTVDDSGVVNSLFEEDKKEVTHEITK
jgi:hypothetical protein